MCARILRGYVIGVSEKEYGVSGKNNSSRFVAIICVAKTTGKIEVLTSYKAVQ